MNDLSEKKYSIYKSSGEAFSSTVKLNFITQLISFITTLMLIRLLTIKEYGIYTLIYSGIGLFDIISSFGVNNVFQRYLPEYFSRGKYSMANKMFYSGSFIRFSISIILLTIVFLNKNYILNKFNIYEYGDYFILFSIILLLHQQRSLYEIGVSSLFLHKYYLRVSLLFVIIKFIGYGLILLSNYSLMSVIIIDALAYVIVLFGVACIYVKKFPKEVGRESRFDSIELKRVFRYGLFYNFNDMGAKVLGVDVDNFFIAYYLDPVSVGIYGFCNKMAKSIEKLLPVRFFNNVFRPLFFSLGHNAERISKVRGFSILMKIHYLIAIPIFFMVLAFGPEMVQILSDGKYVDQTAVFVLIVGISMVNGFSNTVGMIAQLEEKAGIVLLSKVFLVVNVFLAVVLIPLFGVVGAAVATGTSKILKDIFIWWFVRSAAKIQEAIPFFIKNVLAWGGVACLANAIKRSVYGIEVSLLFVIVSLLLVFIILKKSNLFTKDESSLLKKYIECNKDKKIAMLLLRVSA